MYVKVQRLLSPDFDLLPSHAAPTPAGDLLLMLRRVEARDEMALLSEPETEEDPEWWGKWRSDLAVTSALRLISRSRLQ